MAENPPPSPPVGDEQAVMAAMTTEHFTLATAKATATAESGSRFTIYLLSLSSAMVAIGFVAQLSPRDELFDVFVLTVLPTLFVLGLFTFLRLTESSVEDFRYAQAINRIRHYYKDVAGDRAGYFMLSGNDDTLGVWANMSVVPSTRRSFFTMPMAMGFVNSVVGGSTVAIAVGLATGSGVGVSVAGGAVFAIVSLALHFRHNERIFHEVTAAPAMFPSSG
jgi:hypothetical protein